MKLTSKEEQKLMEKKYHYFNAEECGLKPFVFDGAEILILGTAPGEKSLKTGEYYANKGNRFWSVIGNLFETKDLKEKNYEEKKAFLKEHKVALWDVYYDGYRIGSKDKTIKHADYNKIKELLDENPSITKIVVAGGKAQKALDTYKKKHELGVKIAHVMSTSARYIKTDDLVSNWEKALML